jgi:hypothetical protein
MEETFFDLPNVPEEFGVKLPAADLRRIDFTALEFDTLVRACVEYIRTYYPNEFNDWVQNNGIVMLIDLISFVGSIMAERGDVLVQESFLPTSFSEEAVSNHLALINEQINPATPAVIDLEVSVANALPTTLNIPAGLQFNLTGADGNALIFEAYRAPENWEDPIQILPGKRGVIAFGIEGRFETPFEAVSSGGPNQTFDITSEDTILDSPVFVDIVSSEVTTRWDRVDVIERSGPTDQVYQVVRTEDGIRIVFGDDKAGKAPLAGENIITTYRVGGGARGRLGSLRINETRPLQPEPPASATVEVTFRNSNPSSGGEDRESLENAKKRAPREGATLNAAVSGPDYAELATNFSHPVYGAVLKAVAAVRTSLNANVVDLYVLAEGTDGPVKPSAGLKEGIKTYFEEINVITDEVRPNDGEIKRIDLTGNVVMSKSADAPRVKSQVESAIDDFFNVTNFQLGQELYLSDVYNLIQRIDGVKFVTLFEPKDDILKTNKLADPDEHGVGENELIVLGQKQLRFYFE